MRMIESIDSGTTVSSQDMWADICPCAPDIQEMNLSETFSDSFLCPSNGINQDLSTCEAEHDPLCCTQKPWSPLQDSEVYLASLERRLQKIKGRSCEVTSKDMLLSLGQAKKECWDRFLQETFEPEAYVGTSEVDSSTLEHLKRWLQPEKVAISAEEVQCLIPGESPPVNAENEQDSATGEH
ncbi:coiled-coil domain-containing protein 32 isoform X1 [Mixophyes fleayi]|uniref:coiled-coil domain-containing protein 32 isoform X1 n=1 Tax=Mixophyes fleayi TaxID=3061075 RepID=UPI003F4D9BA4